MNNCRTPTNAFIDLVLIVISGSCEHGNQSDLLHSPALLLLSWVFLTSLPLSLHLHIVKHLTGLLWRSNCRSHQWSILRIAHASDMLALHLVQWFSTGGDFATQRTFGNIWRHVWLMEPGRRRLWVRSPEFESWPCPFLPGWPLLISQASFPICGMEGRIPHEVYVDFNHSVLHKHHL